MKTQSAPPTEARVLAILDEYLDELRVGRAPDRGALLARHPELAESLAASFRALDFVHDAQQTLKAPEAPPGGEEPAAAGRVLGDYRLLREIARGGMAVVYEAEQVSLGRRVALKVLPFAAVLDPRQLQRFKNEAQAAAQLQHPHIVPVHAVGCERGVHYYAMQYVEGQSLAVVIREMKERGGLGSPADPTSGGTAGPRTPMSSHGSNRAPAYVRMAAALGVQAAQALDYAHQIGIVHRDVKPGNLLVDLAGTLWVTDFGLAHSIKDVGLTMTGELLGTIRYMSPEQALAKRVPIDHRTDVYSLGATLYELFTLEPAFPGEDLHRVIQDIASKEPVPPRRLNPALPRDVETVLLKAMSKDPAARYATAQEMADDLVRFLENRPIEAKRPGLFRRSAKWTRRHRVLVGAVAGVLVLAVAGLATGTALLWREKEQTRTAFVRAEANLALALRVLDQIYMDEAEGHPVLREGLPADLLEKGLDFYQEFARENAHNQDAALWLGTAHHRAGLILRQLGQEDRAKESLDRAILTYREVIRLQPDLAMVHYNLGIALRAKGDPDGAILEYREAIRLQPDHAEAHTNLGNVLRDKGDTDGGIIEFREAIRLKPDLAMAHNNLGTALQAKGNLDGAILEYREAIRLQPDDAMPHYSLGTALRAQGDPDGAILEYREAIRLKPDYAEAHTNLGIVLQAKGNTGGAVAEYREAIRLQPDLALVHYNLGIALRAKGDLDGAILEYREAIRLQPDLAEAHANLGVALHAKGNLDGAIREHHEAIRLQPDEAIAHYNLGIALETIGDLDGAILQYREAIRLQPDHAKAHIKLGGVLSGKGHFQEALLWLRKGHELGSKRPGWAYPSKQWVKDAERKTETERRLDQMLAGEVRPRDAGERVEFAELLQAKSRHAEAARMYAAAFAEDAALAEDLANGHRYNAACSAALVAASGAPDAAEWRGRALEWLRADLAAREKAPSELEATLEHWKKDSDLAGVRDRPDDLPEPEREAWQGLWAAVDEALASARQAPR